MNTETLDYILSKFSQEIKETMVNGDAFIKPEYQRIFQKHGFHFLLDHFYTPFTSIEDAEKYYERNPDFMTVMAPCLKDEMLASLKDILKYAHELKDVPVKPTEKSFYWDNPFFSPFDSIVYYGMIRKYKPKTILEIGSGFSTYIALMAAEKNKNTQVICIEPNPTAHFLEISKNIKFEHKKVEDCEFDFFKILQEGDFLFVDTSHTVKFGSELNHIMFELLPRISKKVHVHVHDIFLPYEYPKSWMTDIGIQWNEQYLWAAFLMHNTHYNVNLLNYWQAINNSEHVLKSLQNLGEIPVSNNIGGINGGSMWLFKN